MVTKDEALKMAIDVFDMYGNKMNSAFADEAYQSCKEALEQPQWVGLSDDEVHNLADHSFMFASGQFDEIFKFAKAIEAKLKELNT